MLLALGHGSREPWISVSVQDSTYAELDKVARRSRHTTADECAEALRHISIDDVDWAAWRCFYDQGKTPRASIDRALERDL
jgi:hypothetical protein